MKTPKNNDSEFIEQTIDYDWDDEQIPITIQSCRIPSFFENDVGQFDKEFLSFEPIPLSYKQATTGNNSTQWIAAINEELDSMLKHNVWSIVPYQKSIPTVPVKWIFGVKPDGRKKARLVAIGCRDKEEYSAIEKASPTPSIDTTRWLLAYCSYSKIPLVQLDIKTAFLHAPIDREKYINIPPGIPENPKTHIAKLNKALYGLDTAGKCWYN